YTDCAGNSQDYVHTVTITYVDFDLPNNEGTLVTCIDDAQIVPTPPTVSDNCGNNIVPSGPIVSADPVCVGDKTYTWTYTDCSGNSHDWVYTYSVNDNIAPTITTVGADQTVLCDGTGNTAEFQAWLNTNAGANAVDNCSAVTWTYEIMNVIDQCGETSRTLVRFIATDACNNSSTTTALFTILDLVPPTINTQAADLTVECDGTGNLTDLNNWLNNNGGATASDLCGNVNWTNNFTALSDLCGETGSATVIFTATDDCGNPVTTSATFTIVDSQSPITPTAPANIAYECIGDVPTNVELTANDNCSGNITVVGVDSTDDTNPCNVIITRTWTFTDACNNSSSVSQTITVTDTIDPTIDTPASNISIECDGTGNNGAIEAWLANNGGATASDNCGTVTWTNNYGGSASDCSAAIDVIFTATDACGNTASTTASYSIQDTVAPVITQASPETVECDGSGNLTDLNNWLDNNG
ncbi:HYR-like domain-containing protein, partial [Xanthomarina spongicola]